MENVLIEPVKPSRNCVFCGKKPDNKTNEHIIPRWLIEITGDPKRNITAGPIWDSKNRDFVRKTFAYDQLTAPSCQKCNQKYSNFEVEAKRIILSILRDDPLNQMDFSHLLSWFDKVRIGLWLAHYYLQRNIAGIDPNFYIDSRVDIWDRALFIYKSDYRQKRLRFVGTFLPIFQYLPVCFSLIINNYFFFNLSRHFLLSRRLGLPFPVKQQYTEGKDIRFEIEEGRERIMRPLIRKPFRLKCTQLYQPMINEEVRTIIPTMYESGYVSSMFHNFEMGVGKVFMEFDDSLIEYSADRNDLWLPQNTWDDNELHKVIGKQTLEFQLHYFKKGAEFGKITAEKRSLIKAQNQIARDISNLYLGLDD